MKKLLIIIIGLLSIIESQSQCITAKIDTVNAIVMHQYTKKDHYYCIEPTVLLCGNETLYFATNTNINSSIIKEYPYLSTAIGDAKKYSYDFFLEFMDTVFTHNLDFSVFNLLRYKDSHSLVSESLYYGIHYLNDEYCCSIYNLYGSVVCYEGISIMEYLNKNDNTVNVDDDCICKANTDMSILHKKRFVVLKEAFELTPLSTEQECELNVLKMNVNRLNILICE